MNIINIIIITLLIVFGMYLMITAFTLDSIIKKECEDTGFRRATKGVLLIGTMFFIIGIMSILSYFICGGCMFFSDNILSSSITFSFIFILSVILLSLTSTIRAGVNDNILCVDVKKDIDNSTGLLFILSLIGIIVTVLLAMYSVYIIYKKGYNKNILNKELNKEIEMKPMGMKPEVD